MLIVLWEKQELAALSREGFLVLDVTHGIWNPFWAPHLGDKAIEIIASDMGLLSTGLEVLEECVSRARGTAR